MELRRIMIRESHYVALQVGSYFAGEQDVRFDSLLNTGMELLSLVLHVRN